MMTIKASQPANVMEVIDTNASRALLALKIVDGKLVAIYDVADLDEAAKLFMTVLQLAIDRYITERLAGNK